MLAFVGHQGRVEQGPAFGPWMRRSVRQVRVHPNCLKSRSEAFAGVLGPLLHGFGSN